MKNDAELLRNLTYHSGYLKSTIKDGVAALKPYAKELEVVHIRIDYPDPSTRPPVPYGRNRTQKILDIMRDYDYNVSYNASRKEGEL